MDLFTPTEAAPRAPRTVVLVACGQNKVSHMEIARDLYTGDLFRKAAAYADAHGDKWFILSAEHKLLDPSKPVAPYNKRVSATYTSCLWAHRVLLNLGLRLDLDVRPGDRFIILAGKDYVNPLRRIWPEEWPALEDPMEGLEVGERKAWLKTNI